MDFTQKIHNAGKTSPLKNKVGWALRYDLSSLKKGDIDKIIIPDLKELLKNNITKVCTIKNPINIITPFFFLFQHLILLIVPLLIKLLV